MREIRFRGKRVDNGEWVYGYFLIAASMPFISVFGEMNPILVIPESVGQFTGLHDKNGKEVYEGDILRIKGRYFRKTIQEDMVVEYDESRAWFGVLDVLHTVSLNNFDFEDDVEIFGNIHDMEAL